MLSSNEIRQQFIDFFTKKYEHKFIKSAPVAPLDDPTLLFTNAGMNQFKNIFIGTEESKNKRAVNSQKVIRASGKHNDLDDVGVDTYHHTFFEMLGNWSFGDYFKKEAIMWSWELITEVWKLPKDKLWATVYRDDHESFELWKKHTDIDPSHILYFDEKDNFWEMGATGPCGPCSEIHFDKGNAKGYFAGDESKIYKGDDKKHGVNTENPQFMEIWNLVFMQYFRNEDGSLVDLPSKHVDTGMGFERIVAVLQEKNSNYDTDIFSPLIEKMEEISGTKYNSEKNSKIEKAMRVAVDHVRSLSFSIADGALPSNEGRGYVLRRMLRRALRFGRDLDLKKPFLYLLVNTLIEKMGDFYPELKEKQEFIKKAIKSEEEQFNKTLDKGIERFNELVNSLENKIVPGEEAFKLYDTFGFPLDLTEIMAEEIGFSVDSGKFHEEMEKQKERARQAGKFNVSHQDKREWIELSSKKDSEFIGYDFLETETEITKYAFSEDEIHFVLEKTPFYAESGGQIGDRGQIISQNTTYEIFDVQNEGDRIVHKAKSPEKPTLAKCTARVNHEFRFSTANNHTATHLLHKALKEIIGDHVNQAGSMVSEDRLRFDFNHFEKISSEKLIEIEKMVNNEILRNILLETNFSSYDQAISNGATALFGEKYGDEVRSVKIGNFSHELCGGTHVKSTGQIGSFQIISEGSIASGVRRIEAITGHKSFERTIELREKFENVIEKFSSTEAQISDKVDSIISEKKSLEKEFETLKQEIAILKSSKILDSVEVINNISLITNRLDGTDGKTLKQIIANLIQNKENTIIALGSDANGKVALAVAVSNDLTKQFQAGKIVGTIAKIVGGGGGGRPDIATAGGKDVSKIDEALEFVKTLL
jgi:alanyl-tRNA synthetase